tara:strand:- start:548 stop:760 length:213 start_codon:yes stop_codon:yes gene_type:complete
MSTVKIIKLTEFIKPYGEKRENKMKTIKLTQAQLNMLREAWMGYDPDFGDEVEDKRRIKTYETLRKKLWE